MPKPELKVFANAADLISAAADEFRALAAQAVRERDRFLVGLSGGTTPQGLYENLATSPERDKMPWNAVHLFWGDERHVPPDHAQSNYRMVHDALLSNVKIPTANVHRIHSEISSAEKAASDYEDHLRDFFKIRDAEFPVFDLMLLGLGKDGHTASLFPGTAAVRESERWVTAPWVGDLMAHRITLTLPVINNARKIIFLVSGTDKAEVVQKIISPVQVKDRLPAQRVEAINGSVIWYLDRAAATRL